MLCSFAHRSREDFFTHTLECESYQVSLLSKTWLGCNERKEQKEMKAKKKGEEFIQQTDFKGLKNALSERKKKRV